MLCFGWEMLFFVGGLLGLVILVFMVWLFELLCWLMGKCCFDEVECVIVGLEVSMLKW